MTGPDVAGTPKPRTLTYGYAGFLPLATTWGCAGVPPCPAGTVEGTVSREYDDSFRIVKQRVNGAHEVTYGYDTDDLLTTVTFGTALLEITRDPQKGGLVEERVDREGERQRDGHVRVGVHVRHGGSARRGLRNVAGRVASTRHRGGDGEAVPPVRRSAVGVLLPLR